jgi:hypothetical protein
VTTRAVGAVLLSAVVLAVVGGCGTSGLSFVQDERVEILRPADHARVVLPVAITWKVSGFRVGGGAGSFGVLVDRVPPPPGKGLDWLFRNDDLCSGKACDDAAYRAQRGVYRTDQTGVVLREILTHAQRGGDDQHDATVVLLDAAGRRLGEGSWTVQFRVRSTGLGT